MGANLARESQSDCKSGGLLLTAAALAAMACAIVLARLHTYHEPLERDITTYAVAAHEMLNGRQLYAQVWENKPPAVHLTYALAELTAGYGYGEVYLLGVAAALAGLVGVYAAGRRLGGAGAGLWAAAVWMVISGDMILQANQPNTEAFINVCMVWALVALLVRGPAAVLGYKRAALIGLLLGVASLYKQVIVPAAVLLAGVHLLVPAQGSRESWRRRAGQVAVMAGVGIVLWAAVLAVFGAGARFPSFYEAMVTANRERAGSLAANLAAAFTPRRLALPAAGAGLLIAAGLVWRRGLLARTWALLGAWWLGTFVAVALPGMFYPHYFQLWLPLLAAATGLFVTGLGRLAIARPQRVSILAGTVLLATLLAAELPTYFLSPQQWSIRKYKHDLFVQSQQAARQLTGLLAPQDGLYDWGAESGLYFDTGRRPPSGIFFSLPLESPSIAAAAEHRLLVDLQAHPPELVILRRDHLDYYLSGAISVTRWLVERYDPLALPGFPPKFCVFARRGGPLQERMVAVPKPSPPNSPIAFQGRSAG